MTPTRRKFLISGAALVGAGGVAGLGLERKFGARASRPIRVAQVGEIPSVPAGQSLDFFVTGDTGIQSDMRDRVVKSMTAAARRLHPSFVVLVGDNFYPHGITSVEDPALALHFEEPFKDLARTIPFYPCLGNHDHEGDVEAQVAYSKLNPSWRMPSRYHSFRAPVSAGAEAELFILDSYPLASGWTHLLSDPQLAWLRRTLASSPAAWKVTVGHHPLPGGEPEPTGWRLRWFLGPILAECGVDLHLSGHNHVLGLVDSGRGWIQVLSGAGSVPKAAIAPEGSLYWHVGGGFAVVSLRIEAAYVQFVAPAGPLACFRIDRPRAA